MNKRRKKRKIQSIWIDDPCTNPVQNIADFARWLKEQPFTSEIMILPDIYSNKLKELEQRWLDNML